MMKFKKALIITVIVVFLIGISVVGIKQKENVIDKSEEN